MVKSAKENLLLIIGNPYALHPVLATFEELARTYNVFIIVSNNFLDNYKDEYSLLKNQNRIKALYILSLYREDGRKQINARLKELFFILNFIRKYRKIRFKLILSHSSQEMYEYLLIKYFSRYSINTVCLWPLTLNIQDLGKIDSKPNCSKYIKDAPRYLLNEISKLLIYYTNKILFKILFNLRIDNWQRKNLIGTWQFDYIICANQRIREVIQNNFNYNNILLSNFNLNSYKPKNEFTKSYALLNLGLYENQNFEIFDILLNVQKRLKINYFIIRFHPRQTHIDTIELDLRNLRHINFIISRNNPLEEDFSRVDFFISEPSSSLLYALGYFPSDRIYGIVNKTIKLKYQWAISQLEENINWLIENPDRLLCEAIALNNHPRLINIIEDISLKR